MVAGIKELLQAYEGTPAELSSETGQAPTPTVTPEGLVQTVKDFSPASDIENIVKAGESFSEGKYGEGLLKTAEGGLPLLMGAIGTVLGSPAGGAATYAGTKAAIKGSKKATNALRKYYDKLDDNFKKSIPEQPSDTGLWGYHGTAKGEREGEEFFDIKFGNPNDQFLGKGFYFTIDPKVAEEYANLRATKNFQPIPGGKGDTLFLNKETGQKASTESLMKGKTLEGEDITSGQTISRFDLSNIEKPYIVKNNKQRLWAKDPENAAKLKEQGYDSIIFDDFKDRSKQIMVFPEHINKVQTPAITKKKKGGSIVERNPYSNYKPKAI